MTSDEQITSNKTFPLSQDSPSLSRVTPVCLPWKPNDPGSDLSQFKEATVTGWGRVTNNLTEAEINLKELKASSRFISITFLCALVNPKPVLFIQWQTCYSKISVKFVFYYFGFYQLHCLNLSYRNVSSTLMFKFLSEFK